MGDKSQLALVVDQDPVHQEIMEAMLEDWMDVIVASSADECLHSLEYKSPNIVIMDHQIPDMDGLKLCEIIKEKTAPDPCVVIMLTDVIDFEHKMAAYQHGCDDYLTKPFQPEELLHRVQLSVKVTSVQYALKKESADSMAAAITAMKMGSELGQILRFMEESSSISDYEKLAELFISTVKSFQLDSCLILKTHDDEISYGCEPGSNKEQFLAMFRNDRDIVEKGEYVVLNTDNLSVLLTNVPVNNQVRYGELKDSLRILVNSMNARLGSVHVEKELQVQRSGVLVTTVDESNKRLKKIHTALQSYSGNIPRIMADLNDDMQGQFLSLGLSEEQEASLLNMVEDSTAKLDKSYDEIREIEIHFSEVTNELSRLIS